MGRSNTAHHPWPVNKELNAHMAMRQKQNLARSVPAEKWMADYLKRLTDERLTWRRQARWGFRLYDFWCHQLGVAVEVDGPTHNMMEDATRDALDWKRSAIRVLRVRNYNDADAIRVCKYIRHAEGWNAMREAIGKPPIRGAW